MHRGSVAVVSHRTPASTLRSVVLTASARRLCGPRGALMAIKAPGGRMVAVTARRPTVQRIDDPDEEAPDVRLAEQRDVPRIAATLTIALADSRWTRWALPDDGRMQRLTRLHELDAGAPGRLDADARGSPRTSPPSRCGSRPPGTAPLPGRRVRGAGPGAALPRGGPVGRRPRHRRARRRGASGGAALVAGPPRGPADVPAAGAWRRRCSRRCWCAATPRARSRRPPSPAGRTCGSCAGSASRSPLTGRTTDDELPLWVLVRQPLRR